MKTPDLKVWMNFPCSTPRQKIGRFSLSFGASLETWIDGLLMKFD
jgi:hypothetical protein